MDVDILRKLEERLGPLHARHRLGIERDHEAQVFGQGLTFFHLENWLSAPAVIRTVLKLTGLYWRARRNAERIVVKQNDLRFTELPPAFDGFSNLHISDLHADMNEVAMQNLIHLVGGLQYDLCVLTGDYRGKTFGPFEAAMEGLATVRAHLKQPIYGVLGNHDTIQMVPAMETMGIQTLLNECATITRGNQRIYLAGIADAYVETLVKKAKALVVGNPLDEKVQVGPIVSERQAANVERIVTETIAKGAKLRSGGSRKGLFFEPTVISGVTPGMAAFDEEIFGPIAPVTTFRNDEEAVALANATQYGLTAAVVSADLARAQCVADGLHSGVVHINDQTVLHGVYGPIGGVGISGNGFGHSTLTNADQFSEWQWITTRSQVPAYPF